MLPPNRIGSRARLGLGLTLVLGGLISAATLVLGPARLASAHAAVPSWSYTGNLNTGRFGHTATLLQNGKVLVAAGDNCVRGDCFIQNTAELYDSASGTWSYTGSLNTARMNHTATLLPNGKVLVVGGLDAGDFHPLNSAELYDPATGIWSLTGSLNETHNAPTATLLPNGKVLVAGGCVPLGDVFCGGTNRAEQYDPATGTWSFSGNINTNRLDHTATLLADGKVLFTGGNFLGTLYSAELFDPATGGWSSNSNLNRARGDHCATLLPGGKVLASGGAKALNGGYEEVNSAELYDPAARAWSLIGNLNTARFSHTATLLPNGKVLVVGGRNNNFNVLYSAELYDQATGTWSYTANLNTAHSKHTATLLPNGKVLVVGGWDSLFDTPRTAELYDSGANQIDSAQFFVGQHYRDFLNRDADAGGLAFWINEIDLCGFDLGCIEAKRINVSAAFFVSIEFQQTGYLVYRIYKSSYGNLGGAPVPINFSEFLPDTQEIGQGVIVNQAGWEQVLENNKQAFMAEFVQRSRFMSLYPGSMTPVQFVNQLFMNAGVTPSASDRTAAINEFGSATTTSDTGARSRALRRVAENSILAQQEFNRAFVLMQYFGYLRRNPNDPPELTLDFQGYNFWLDKLNNHNGNFRDAEMVKAFLVSSEYRRRFGEH